MQRCRASRLRSETIPLAALYDLLFGGLGSYPHRYSFVNVRLGQDVGIGINRRALFRFLAIANERRAAG
jgi:hypothetical protein